MKVFRIRCNGHVHRVGYDGKVWVLFDHDLKLEKLAMQLGRKPPKCVRLLQLIRDKPSSACIWGEMKYLGIGNRDLIGEVKEFLDRRHDIRRERARLKRPDRRHCRVSRYTAIVQSVVERRVLPWAEEVTGYKEMEIKGYFSSYSTPGLHLWKIGTKLELNAWIRDYSSRSVIGYPWFFPKGDRLYILQNGQAWEYRWSPEFKFYGNEVDVVPAGIKPLIGAERFKYEVEDDKGVEGEVLRGGAQDPLERESLGVSGSLAAR